MAAPRRIASRALATLALTAVAALGLSACAGDGGPEGGGGDDGGNGDSAEAVVGISQFVQHPALDAATAGFKRAILDAGFVEGETVRFDEKNAQAEMATATLIAQTFANDGVDLVLAVATPAAQAAAQSITDIPVLFTAVTDPLSVHLVASADAPGANISGTSDLNPVDQQFALLREIVPDAKRVGIVYGSGEVNSEIQLDLAEESAQELGLELVTATVTNPGEIQQAAESLGEVDAIYTPSDNLVASGLAALIGVAEERGIPVIGAESAHVEGGAVATIGIDYERLGYQTGEMAVRVLKDGTDPAAMPVEYLEELELVINPDAAQRFGIELPAAVRDRADRTLE